jgi:hypothetical protein
MQGSKFKVQLNEYIFSETGSAARVTGPLCGFRRSKVPITVYFCYKSSLYIPESMLRKARDRKFVCL